MQGEGDNAIGVYASSNRLFALYVQGPAAFSTVGSGAVPAGQKSVFVANPAVTAQSYITATLTGDPSTATVKGGSAPSLILWVERQPGTGFVVHLTSRVGAATPFTYLIVEPA